MRRRRPPAATLTVSADPVLHAGATAGIVAEIEGGEGTLRVFLRLLGWDMRVPQKWLLAEQPAGAGRHALTAALPRGLPPGCARLTEYAIFAELAGQRVSAAAAVRLIADPEDVFWPDEDRAGGAPIELEAEVVALGGRVRGRVAPGTESVEIGPELRTDTGRRFASAATAVAAADGSFTADVPADAPPTLYDGEDTAVVWSVRAGEAWRTFAVTDPEASAAERRPALLTFIAHLARDNYL